LKPAIRLLTTALILLGVGALSAPAFAQAPRTTLAAGQERGYLRCGVNPGQLGMSMADASGEWVGMSADLCRAIAAATLGDPAAAEFVPVTAGNRFTALRSGQIDVILRNTTWTFTRDTAEAVQFAGPFFVDEEMVMVAEESGITDLSQLNERTVCVIDGGPSEVIMNDLAAASNTIINIIPVGSAEQYRQAYLDGRCVGIADGQAALRAMQISLPDPDAHRLVSDRLAYSPLSIGTRQGDDHWTDIVRWTLNVLALAEEAGMAGADIGDLDGETWASQRQRLDTSGIALGLEPGWAIRAVQAAGNLGEIYDRSFGPDSDLPIPRGPSALWRDGGMIVPPPL
jgi:general L-amino acid transport system substrate-binding protein